MKPRTVVWLTATSTLKGHSQSSDRRVKTQACAGPKLAGSDMLLGWAFCLCVLFCLFLPPLCHQGEQREGLRE